ncbi:HAD-IB family phosphatase [Ancylothrix sp. C2]|uniref:HAD-IB family phosphatase n=1 Tax=Ancylothrix sp. D3o TaxID=2953691 RepID=UPI0021BB6DE9|nr:HAD-IB family phosphatase [Ancylothrix sp. D3o]MCT7948721.1 HAD-IB family phosphatase [Ancylothrix sp. D3o]
MKNPNKIIFCDFDGTITAEETFVAMLKHFTPELSAKLMPEMYELRLTLRQGVRQLLESIPSKKYPEILEYSSTKKIRTGFIELLDYLDSQNIPFIVVSGGLRGMVETVLGPLKNRVQAIYAVDVDTSSEYLQVKSPFEAGNELVSKVSVMEKHPTEQTIAIGDSVTDLNMAMEASLVFARDRLIHYLNDREKPYIPWDNFLDIRNYLNNNP